MARGAFPDSHPQHLGMPGMHGTVPAVLALQEADLLISLGARFDDRVTGKAAVFAPNAKVVHVDIDPAEIAKIRTPTCRSWATLKDVLVDLDRRVPRRGEASEARHSTSGGRTSTGCRPSSRSATSTTPTTACSRRST